MLVALGVDVRFVTDPAVIQQVEPASVMVVAQKTRVAPAADAVRKSDAAARALLALGTRQLFFKYCATFDSTDEGNIGPVADSLLQLTGQPATIFCPSAPELERTVYNGHLFVGAQLVSDSPKRYDPLTPMTDPNLVGVLQRQSKLKVGLLPHRLINGSADRLSAHVAEQSANGTRHFIVDAIHDEDLDAIAALTVDWKVITGNSPIVQHYPSIWRQRGLLAAEPKKQTLPAVAGHAAVLAGSCAERTLEQLAAFEKSRPVLRIKLAAVESPDLAVADALEWARSHIASGPIAIATSAPPDDVLHAQEKLGRDGAAALAETILGKLAVALREMGVRRLIVAGGETSGTIVESLDIDRLTIGRYSGPGVARAVSQENDPMALCLKSGKLGPVDMFLSTLEQMTEAET